MSRLVRERDGEISTLALAAVLLLAAGDSRADPVSDRLADLAAVSAGGDHARWRLRTAQGDLYVAGARTSRTRTGLKFHFTVSAKV